MGFNKNIVLAFALVIAVLLFVWHTELYTLGLVSEVVVAEGYIKKNCVLNDNNYFYIEHDFTNGFIMMEPEQVYHILMYLMFGVVSIAAWRLVKNA